MSLNAFLISGNTVEMDVTATLHSTVQVKSGGDIACCQYVITNTGPNTAWIASSPQNADGSAPTVTVAIPTDGTPANGFPVLSGTSQAITAAPNAYFAAICASTKTAALYITPGDGI